MEKRAPAVDGKEGWRKIGMVRVDTGRVLVLDPCYLQACAAIEEKINDLSTQDFYETLEVDGLIDGSMSLNEVRAIARANQHRRTLSAEFEINDQGATAVVSHSGLGDGFYPVYGRVIQTERDGPRVAGLWIDLEMNAYLHPQY